MTILQALILGALQGIAEFLPISSSGHLAIVEYLFNLKLPVIFDICLHISTLLSVILVFRKKIWYLLCIFGRFITRKTLPEDKVGLSMIVALLLGTVVTGVIGILSSKFLPELPIKLIFIGFFITAALLLFSSKYKSKKEPSQTISIKQGLFVGFAQGIGTLPGISRSGITISAGLFSNMDRCVAGEFSFILSIPAILGAFLLEIKDFGILVTQIDILPLLIGCITSFTVGVLSLTILMKLIKKGKLEIFSIYLIAIGILGLILISR